MQTIGTRVPATLVELRASSKPGWKIDVGVFTQHACVVVRSLKCVCRVHHQLRRKLGADDQLTKLLTSLLR